MLRSRADLAGRHLTGLEELSAAEIRSLLDAASRHADRFEAEAAKTDTLRGRVVVLGFLEPSTRTRVSFEVAGKRLAADTVSIAATGSSLEKGESLADTAWTLESMGADVLVLRHPRSGVPLELAARLSRTAVVNGGDGWREHPTQTLSDLLALERRGVSLEGLRLAVVGDVTHSRVARSAIYGFTALGAHVVLCGPPTLVPPGLEGLARPPGSVEVTHDLDRALTAAGAVMALRLQRERQEAGLIPSLGEYARLYQVNVDRMRRAAPDAVVLHPGPMNRGVEIDSQVADAARSLVRAQVACGVAVRCAVLERACGTGAWAERASDQPALEEARR